jgi:hypothetical protein
VTRSCPQATTKLTVRDKPTLSHLILTRLPRRTTQYRPSTFHRLPRLLLQPLRFIPRTLRQRPQILQLPEKPGPEAIKRRAHLIFRLTDKHKVRHREQNPRMLQRPDPAVPLRARVGQLRAPAVRLLEVELLFWMHDVEVGGPGFARAVGVRARVEGRGRVAGWGGGFPAEAHFQAGPEGGLEAWVDDFGRGGEGPAELFRGEGPSDCGGVFGAVHGL